MNLYHQKNHILLTASTIIHHLNISSSFLVSHYFALKMSQVIFLPDRCLIDSHNCMIAYGNIKSRFKGQLLSTIKENKGLVIRIVKEIYPRITSKFLEKFGAVILQYMSAWLVSANSAILLHLKYL